MDINSSVEVSKSWCLDSGATAHLCNNLESFSNINPHQGVLNLANNKTSKILGKGTAQFVTKVCDKVKNVSLADAAHVPDLRTNFLSVWKITDRGYNVVFTQNRAKVYDSGGDIKLCADRVGDLYYLQETRENACVTSSLKIKRVSVEVLHKQLDHVNVTYIQTAVKNGVIKGVQPTNTNNNFNCDVCLKGKMCNLLFRRCLTGNPNFCS